MGTAPTILGPVEADLVVLAGMAEEHEGFSELLRVLHPRRVGADVPQVSPAGDEDAARALRVLMELVLLVVVLATRQMQLVI